VPVVPDLHLERSYPVAPPALWRLLVEPELLVQWWGPHGFTSVVEQWEVHPGRAYRIAMRPPEGSEFHLRGEFREVVPEERLVFTFVWEEPQPDDVPNVVTITLRDDAAATVMTIDHGPFMTEERSAPPRAAWTDTFEKIESLLAAGI
jgi:uncharacterized protein YndB with AHSA1/START domain